MREGGRARGERREGRGEREGGRGGAGASVSVNEDRSVERFFVFLSVGSKKKGLTREEKVSRTRRRRG